jgi:membrane glycosyltransferase
MQSPFIIPGSSASRVTRRRVSVVLFALFGTALASVTMADLLWGAPMRGWNIVVLAVFTFLFALLSYGAGLAFFGFISRRHSDDPLTLAATLPAEEEASAPLAPTAIVLPIYNESVARVFAGLRAMFHSVRRTGQLAHFDFFVLSDTTDPDIWVAEEAAWAALLREPEAHGHIFYRRRRVNTNRKAGNIADFCRRWGRRYRHMIVLDADSMMTGPTFVRLVRLMERNPGVGLIQTAPILVRAETFFARVFQFAVRLYGPLFISGVNYWQQGDGNYWGHNAIIRLAPFMEYCALPGLPGREPLGGRILSHDFVEVALLRRAGWAAWMLPVEAESAEECPPTLIDYAKRDRRWCQGNLQHVWLLFARGLHPISRSHLLLGILAYSASLIWLTFMVLSTLLMMGFQRTGLTWMPEPGFAASLGFSPQTQTLALLGFTVLLMFAPKFFALCDLALRRGAAATFGGWRKLLAGVAVESLFAALAAPVLMLFHAKFVVLTILGRSVGWPAQQRASTQGTSWREALATHSGQTVLGLTWTGVIAYWMPQLLPWMIPVLAGMIVSIPLSVLSSRPSAGRRARELGLFCTPEELAPGPELREIEAGVRQPSSAFGPANRWRGVMQAVLDPYVNAIHVCLLRRQPRQSDELRRHFSEKRERLLREGPQALTHDDLMALLSDVESVDWLHRELWLRRRHTLALPWRQALRPTSAAQRQAA